ncbi:contact-dependent growth inhibition system immunity protein [Streptomyces sp. NBC_01462]|uniref:contact-dependent growth inhibition system immunity protein n=1 Tax=Streptomyces sp. NBC_01462 TaxID=2903876 RepID=UPI002E338A60|nr:contact-dependent growth inhibition system immunity protein [Streptomyces sp. NBC_01462]
MTVSVDRSRSIEELEHDRWPAPPPDATRLIATAHALRSRPVGTLTVEDLRLLIGQDIGLAVLLPLAVEVLRDNPLAEGHMGEGDLLRAVLARTSAVWSVYPDLARQLTFIVGSLSDLSPDLRSEVERFVGLAQNP